MTPIDFEAFKQDPENLLKRIQADEHLLVMLDGQAIAVLHPLPQPRTQLRTEPRPFGLAKGEFVVPDDFDDPLPEEILREFGV